MNQPQQQQALTPPDIGSENWGPELNAYLEATEARTVINDQRIDGMEATIQSLQERIEDLEAKPEHIYNSFAWQYSNQAPPPTGNQVRCDNADLSQATVMVFRLIDSDGADRTQVFRNLAAGSEIRINDWDDASNLHRFTVIGPANVGASDVTVPVVWLSGSGTIPNAKVNVAFLVVLPM